MSMSDVYQKLLELQNLLLERFKLEEKSVELPKILSTRKEVLNRLKRSYLLKYDQFKKLEQNIFAHQRMMGELSLQQQKIAEKFKIVTSQKEYEHLDNELALAKRKEEEYRFHLLQDQRVIEDLRNALEKDEMAIRQQEEELQKEEERIKGELSEIEKQLEEIKKKEDVLTKDLDEDIRYKFERIVRNKEGIGLVKVVKNYCTGCYLTIPLEFINKIRENKSIQFCPNCSRILYYDESSDSIFSFEEIEETDEDFFEEELEE